MTKQTSQHPALDQTITKLKDMIEDAEVLAEQGQQAALTHQLLKIGRTLYSAIALTEISPSGGDLVLDLRNPSA